MAIKENIEYWKVSLEYPEPALDDFYIFDEIIVSDTELINEIERLRELIISYCVVSKMNIGESKILDEIYNIIVSIEKIQYTEFVAFWKALYISYSVFRNLPDNKNVLKEILQKYCERRQKLYDKLGYTNVTVQALYDIGSSRKKGVSGIQKIINLIKEKIKFEGIFQVKDINELINSSVAYFLPDKGDEIIFNDFCKKLKIKYKFGKEHQGKQPDIVIKINNIFFIIEAKHIK